METIFNHNVTEKEVTDCGFFDEWQRIRHGIDFEIPITEEVYRNQITEEAAIFDIALLLEYRGKRASRYWKKIPEKAAQYRRGNDDIQSTT